jgi:dihydroorotate dehydrogenase (fumarate)
MTHLQTTYLGLDLPSPLVISSIPLTASLENIQQFAELGAGAVILPSLFEEQIQLEDAGLDWYLQNENKYPLPSILKDMPRMDKFNKGSGNYLATIYQAKKVAGDMRIIASLNGNSKGGWIRYARMMQSAGADALELNIYHLPTETYIVGSEVEGMYVRLVEAVKESVTIPVSVKLNPYFSSIPNIIHQLAEAGADGVVLFNRFYEPDFDIETETVTPNLHFSTSEELRLRLRWVAILYKQVKTSMAITGGVHTADDVIKALLAGADVAMMASAILQKGPQIITHILAQLSQWMESHGYSTVSQMQGRMSQRMVHNPGAFERANYVQVLQSYQE